jgi:branched-chain amino acid transport system substrate-binding protein
LPHGAVGANLLLKRTEVDGLRRGKRTIPVVVLLLVVGFALAAAGCGGGGGGGKTLKIVSDLPLQGATRELTGQMNDAITSILQQQDNKAGKYNITFEAHDDSVASTGAYDEAKCADNARSYVADSSVVGVIGTYNSPCAAVEIPITNEATLAMISPANTYAGLTHSAPGTEKGEPSKYYPTGTRNYARVVATDDYQGKIGASFMKDDLGVKKVYILDDKELYGKGVADAFETEAKSIGLTVAGHSGWDQNASNYTALMTSIKATGADGLYLGGLATANGGQLMKDKNTILGSNQQVKVLVSDGLVLTSLFQDAGASNVNGAYGTAPTQPPDKLTGAGKAFVDSFQKTLSSGSTIQVYTVYAATAAQVLLNAIANSDGTRADVVKQMFATNLPDAVTGSISFTPNGDVAGGTESIYIGANGNWQWKEQKSVS